MLSISANLSFMVLKVFLSRRERLIPARHKHQVKALLNIKFGLLTPVNKQGEEGVIISTGIIGAYHYEDSVLPLYNRVTVFVSASIGVPLTSSVSDIKYFNSRISILKSQSLAHTSQQVPHTSVMPPLTRWGQPHFSRYKHPSKPADVGICQTVTEINNGTKHNSDRKSHRPTAHTATLLQKLLLFNTPLEKKSRKEKEEETLTVENVPKSGYIFAQHNS